jgi:hypothetical protein
VSFMAENARAVPYLGAAARGGGGRSEGRGGGAPAGRTKAAVGLTVRQREDTGARVCAYVRACVAVRASHACRLTPRLAPHSTKPQLHPLLTSTPLPHLHHNLQFVWPHPGQPQPEGQDASVFRPDPPDPKSPPSTFCLVLLYPEEVDHLELKADPQRRTAHRLVGGVCEAGGTAGAVQGYRAWETVSVNP